MELKYNIIVCFSSFVVMVTSITQPNPDENSVPAFNSIPQLVYVNEDRPAGTFLATLSIANGLNPALNTSSEFVKLIQTSKDAHSAKYNMTLSTPLDYEALGSRITITLIGGNSRYNNIPYIINMTIRDLNDETPVFKNRPYSIYIKEDVKNGTNVYSQIQAIDADYVDKTSLRYSFVGTSNNAKFAIDRINATIWLIGSLDYETDRFLQYTVMAQDTNSVHNATTDVFITVIDVQDSPPYFIGTPYMATIKENSHVGLSVLSVKAADGDMGSPNSVSLAIVPGSESCPGLFVIDPVSGDIHLKIVPDRDSGQIFNNSGSCHFKVQATEGDEHPQSSHPPRNVSITDVTVTIEDVDDNKPEFLSKSYKASVAENTQEGVPITLDSPIKVKDIDQGENARFAIIIKNPPNVFEASPNIVESSADIIIRVKNASFLDYETRQSVKIELEVQPITSHQNNNWNSAEITLNLINLNDEVPQFSSFTRSTSVAENVPIGQSIITIVATDKDSNADGNNFGKVTYSLDNPDPVFRIDPNSGIVYTRSNIDRETKDVYYITVAAEDGGKRKVTTQLTIKVTDVNDKTPSFVTDDYQTSLQEMETKFVRPITVHATDDDDHSTANSVVKYSIISSNPTGLHSHFLIDNNSGTLSVKSDLSYESITFQEPGKITLTVMAEDQGRPPLNSTVKVVIMLQDINNNAPICNRAVYPVSRLENSFSASPVVTVHASDADGTAPNNVVMYSIDQQSLEKFIINSSSGEIVLRSNLDRETQDHYTITVTVTDFGIPSKTGSCQITVTVLDINDSPPKFLEKDKEVIAKENTTNLHFNMSARDEDSDNKLYYDINWSKSVATDPYDSAVDINIVKAWVSLNHSTGEVISVAKFDRELVKKFTLNMVVTDEKSQTGPQNDTGNLTVIVEDVNDQVPTFVRGTQYIAEISENMPVGSEITIKTPDSLIVQDLDEAANSLFTVKLLTHENDFSLKKIDSKDGQSFSISVLNAPILDYEQIQKLELKLEAVESNTPEHYSSTATVTVNIINKNDNMPEFIGAPFQGHVKENDNRMTSVTQVKAKDDDKGDYGIVLFSLLGNQNQFIINQTTGVVYTNQSLDREKQQTYSLSVHVQDSGGFGTTTQLTVTVDDMNDMAPHFKQMTYNVTIPENQPQFVPPLVVEAYDDDEPGNFNSQIKYSIIHLQSVFSMIQINSNTGEIHLTRSFDYEAMDPNLRGVLTLTVQAQDQGVPKHSVNQIVTITVRDVNDVKPQFQQTHYTVNIPENITTGTLISQQSAIDRDFNVENKNISYSIDTLSAATFIMDEMSGSLTLKNPLDREKMSSYDVILTARDHGSPVLSSTAVIHIDVTDVNDEKPHFDQNQMFTNILENRDFSFECAAKDSDANPNLVYSIDFAQSTGLKVTGETVDGLEKWLVIKDVHVCNVTSLKKFDREIISRMTIKIQVNDTNAVTNIPQIDNATLVVDILDENDYPPTFNSLSYTASIQENMPVGSNVKFNNPVLLQITDLDGKGINSHYNVSIIDSLKTFAVDPVFGDGQQIFAITVLNSSALDFETRDKIAFEIIAKDQTLTRKATITVNIINENDNIPEFNSSTYTASVPEKSRIGTLVTTTVKAVDKDKGEFGQVSYSLKDDSGKFYINSTTGYIYTKTGDLDREATPNYIVTVTARDKKGFSSITQLTISITDVNDNSPVFTQQNYTVSVDEGSSQFQPPFFAHATDADDPSSSNSQIEYTLLHATSVPWSNFGINSLTGELVIKTPLDYEVLHNNGLIVLNIQAKDKGVPSLTSNTSITVNVVDINDEPPVFLHPFYNISVLENVTSGYKVIEVHATDSDKSSANNVVSYRLDALSNNKFSIQSDGTLTVQNSLDREQMPHYNITVTAFDNGQPTMTTTTIVSVNINDVNDSPPQFNTESASVTVTENSNKTFYTCIATDPDINKNLKFSIDWSSSSGVDGRGQFVEGVKLQKYIRINNVTGEVSPFNVIDRESIQRFQLTLVVKDMNGIPGTNQNDTAILTVVVNDENDNPPDFLGSTSFNATILENTANNNEVKLLDVSALIIEDPDGENNNVFIVDMTKNNAFYIEPTNGTGRTTFNIKVANSTLLDYEKVQNFTFNIIAQDFHRPSLRKQATIFIQLENENDNIPEFIGAPYKANISEKSQPHTSVTTVIAKDADKGKFGSVAYYLIDDSKKFDIDRVTGKVFSLVDNLDRETQSTYIVTVLAKDYNNFTATTQLTIDVTDFDDMSPVFSEENYIFKINENEPKSGFFVHADDADQPNTPNSYVLYTLIDADPSSYRIYFTIDNTSGEITVHSPLDYETVSLAKINLTVQAQDQGTSALTGTANIEFVVLDINDNAPKFQKQNYVFSVPENALPDNSVGGILAKDDDGTSPNNEVFYVIQSGSQDKFQINSTSGLISVGVGAGLDREFLSSYHLVVLAVDRGTPAKTCTTQVIVNITDVNDVPPEIFSSTSLIQSIPENSSLDTMVFNVSAKDLDITAQLKYSILWNQSKVFDEKDREVNILKVQKWLVMNESTGIISVASEMDREKAQQIVMKIVVEDVNAVENKPQTATASVTVILTDVNDNSPVIHIDGGGSVLHLNVSEGTKIDTEVTTLIATDADKDQGVTFSVSNSKYFTISSNGRLKLNSPLDREKQGKVSFVVIATDTGNPPLSYNISVDITVLDTNDNDPEFVNIQTVFYVMEHSNISHFVGQVNATDKDIGLNGFVTYEFRDVSPFAVNNITGVITVAGEIDREIKAIYTLTVLAMDNPELEQRRRASLVIQIVLNDTNDQPPVFNIPPGLNYTGRVGEDRKVNDVINIQPKPISASDRDIGQNAYVTYTLKTSYVSFFDIETLTGQVFVNESMLGNPGDYSLTVVATDHGEPPLETEAYLTITILDVNNNKPYFIEGGQFSGKGPIPSIPECTELEFSVYTFLAEDDDKDKTSNALIKYYLMNSTESPDADYFLLNPDSGTLQLNKKLSSEQKNILKIAVQAKDSGDPQLSSDILRVNISVLDINDHAPVFDQRQKTEFSLLEEIQDPGTEVGAVTATDQDVGSQLNCEIDDPTNPWRDYFEVVTVNNGRCIIYDRKPLDRENITVVSLNLKVVDKSVDKAIACKFNPSSDNKESKPVKVTINILDINDNPPVYYAESLSKGFLSNSEVGKTILNLNDYVTDRDTAANSKHQFYQLGQLEADEDLSKGWTFSSIPDPIKVDINGSVKTNYKFPEDRFGAVTLKVLVNDSAGNDTLDLKIFVVGSSQVVEFSFYKSEDELMRLQQLIAQELSDNSITFIPDDIVSFKDGENNVDGSKSVLLMHAIQDGKIIDASHLKGILDYNKVQTLQEYKIIKTETQDEVLKQKKETTDNSRVQYILIGIIAAIALTFVITLFMLIHNIRRFKRKLKAATIEVHGMEPMKFPGLEDNPLKESNPIFMRDDVTLDSMSESDPNYSYSQRSENSLDKNALGHDVYAEDEQEVTMNMYGGDAVFTDPSDLPSPMRYLNDVFLEEDHVASRIPGERGTVHPDDDLDDDDDVFNFNVSQYESTDI